MLHTLPPRCGTRCRPAAAALDTRTIGRSDAARHVASRAAPESIDQQQPRRTRRRAATVALDTQSSGGNAARNAASRAVHESIDEQQQRRPQVG